MAGLTNGTSYTFTVKATNTAGDSSPSTASAPVTPASSAWTPTFDTPVRTAGGFTVNVTNYDASYAWTPASSAGTVTAGTPSGSTLPLTVTGLSAGASSTVTVTTSRSGYSNGSASVTGQAKSTQTVSWSPVTAITTVQSPLTPSASATTTGGGAITYGKVSNTTASCSVDVNTGALTYTGTGNCVVRATAAATASSLEGTRDVTFTVSKATQAVSWSPTTALVLPATTVTPTAATSLGSAPISYSKVSSTTSSCSVDSSTGAITYAGTGSCVVRASAAETDDYAAGSTDVTFTVTKATPTLTWNPTLAVTVPEGSTTFAAATTTGDGAISYTLSGVNTAGCTLAGRTLSFTQEGSCEVTATSSATADYDQVSSVKTFAVSKAAQVVTWSPTTTLTLASVSAALGAATTSGDGAVTYAVTSAGGTGCSFASPSSPTMTYSTVGSCTVTATAAATTGYAQGTQSVTLTISRATPTLTWTPTTGLTMPAATVNPGAATTSGDGAITYAVTSGSNCSVDTNTGALSYTTTGSCQVTATSAMTTRYAAGSIASTFVVSLAPQAITGSASSATLQPGGTATLTDSGSTGTGAVTWMRTSGVGVCTLAGTTVTAVSDGTCVLTVDIAADATYAAASSTVTISVVTPGSGGGGGSGSGGGASSVTPPPTAAAPTSTRPDAVSTDAVRPPGSSTTTLGRTLPPPPLRVQVTPMRGRPQAMVVVGQPASAAGSSVLSTMVVVRDARGKVVSRIELPVTSGQQQTEVVVPFVANGYTVNVYNVNEVGVSTGAMRTSPLVHATTISSRTTPGTPTLFGSPVGEPVVFSGGSARLDSGDRAQLDTIARSAKASSERLFITGFARRGGAGTARELASLSTARAKAVAAYLARQGVRVWIRYWGAGTLNGTGDDSDRRVEIRSSGLPIPRSLVP